MILELYDRIISIGATMILHINAYSRCRRQVLKLVSAFIDWILFVEGHNMRFQTNTVNSFFESTLMRERKYSGERWNA